MLEILLYNIRYFQIQYIALEKYYIGLLHMLKLNFCGVSIKYMLQTTINSQKLDTWLWTIQA
jgi:hypothetical protein